MGIRKPGLWHGLRKVEVQLVTARHKKECDECGELPEEQRLIVEDGVGRGSKRKVRCVECGILWIQEHKQEATRALRYLRTGNGSIRNSAT